MIVYAYLKKTVVFVMLLTIISCGSINSLSLEDIRFCYDRELWDVLSEYKTDIVDMLDSNPQENVLYEVLGHIYLADEDTLSYVGLLDTKVNNIMDLNDAFRLLNTLKISSDGELEKKLEEYKNLFPLREHQIMLEWSAGIIETDEMKDMIAPAEVYPEEFENRIRSYIDEIAVERDDSLRVANAKIFAEKYPVSAWQDLNRYLLTVSKLNLGSYDEVVKEITGSSNLTTKSTKSMVSCHLSTLPPFHDLSGQASLSYLYASLLQNPALLKNYQEGEAATELLNLSKQLIRKAAFPDGENTIRVIYNHWDKQYWENKSSLLEAKSIYYLIIQESEEYQGDETIISPIANISQDLYDKGTALLKGINYPNNDYGEIAELKYWQGRFAVLDKRELDDDKTAEYFIDCLIAGAPRKRFDVSAFEYLSYIHQKREIPDEIMDWCRIIKEYDGPVFRDITEQSGLRDMRRSRVAVGDYDNDGYTDILLNGRTLFRNRGDMTFENVTDNTGIVNHGFVGGLWADYDKDGHLDFAAFSRNLEGEGNKLYRNNGDGTFSVCDESDINDYSPTEGAAWVDIDNRGYPSLYLANYERWQVQAGFEDYFFYNEKGVFTNKTVEFGFRSPKYTTDPGLAGRGVSPADYNNDGKQSIFVSNYRLTRNFLWDRHGDIFVDTAALNSVRGHLQRGYYGHTIGVDWGDFNNNGFLDLFLCNLAHPRFLEFSDISMLLRNDGEKVRKIGNKTIRYHQFTDITKEAGITFDELHSDPNWFDANNNGYLDLYITSIYENDRSYFYLNNKDGTFTDVTFLSGTRVYNGWGNAVADFNHNGRLDLVVGSGSGVKLFKNVTVNDYQSVSYKPYWDGEEVKIVCREDWTNEVPNSPAFGTRITVRLVNKDGEETVLMRELNGGKGTTSQNDQYLHFGVGENRLIEAKIWQP